MYKRLGTIVLTVGLAFTLTACTQGYMKNNEMRTKSNENPLQMNGQRTANVDQAMSDRILKQVLKMHHVKHATVFVHGNDIVAGLDVQDTANKGEIEQSVRNNIQAAHSGYKVHVTADKGLHDRIVNVHSQMLPLDGHPVRNFATDVEVLIQDIGHTITAPFRAVK